MSARAKVAAMLAALCEQARPGCYELHAYCATHARDVAPIFGVLPATLRRQLDDDGPPLGGDDAEIAPVVLDALRGGAVPARALAAPDRPPPDDPPPAPPAAPPPAAAPSTHRQRPPRVASARPRGASKAAAPDPTIGLAAVALWRPIGAMLDAWTRLRRRDPVIGALARLKSKGQAQAYAADAPDAVDDAGRAVRAFADEHADAIAAVCSISPRELRDATHACDLALVAWSFASTMARPAYVARALGWREAAEQATRAALVVSSPIVVDFAGGGAAGAIWYRMDVARLRALAEASRADDVLLTVEGAAADDECRAVLVERRRLVGYLRAFGARPGVSLFLMRRGSATYYGGEPSDRAPFVSPLDYQLVFRWGPPVKGLGARLWSPAGPETVRRGGAMTIGVARPAVASGADERADAAE